jgi:hypothetical protein
MDDSLSRAYRGMVAAIAQGGGEGRCFFFWRKRSKKTLIP